VGRINKALASLPWVEKHSVDFANKRASIVVNEKYDPEVTLQVISSLGFGATIL
jgi:hypothetical protein